MFRPPNHCFLVDRFHSGKTFSPVSIHTEHSQHCKPNSVQFAVPRLAPETIGGVVCLQSDARGCCLYTGGPCCGRPATSLAEPIQRRGPCGAPAPLHCLARARRVCTYARAACVATQKRLSSFDTDATLSLSSPGVSELLRSSTTLTPCCDNPSLPRTTHLEPRDAPI